MEVAHEVEAAVQRLEHPELLGEGSPYGLYLSIGHDEYWSGPMRDTVEAFTRAGGNALFLSGNTSFWQVRLEDADGWPLATVDTGDERQAVERKTQEERGGPSGSEVFEQELQPREDEQWIDQPRAFDVGRAVGRPAVRRRLARARATW